MTRRKKIGRPLVLIINSTHLLRDDEDGRDVLELIQQRAEQWAASNLVTIGMVLSTARAASSLEWLAKPSCVTDLLQCSTVMTTGYMSD